MSQELKMEVEFKDFIAHYKGWFKEDNIDQFFEYWDFAERIRPPVISSRQDSEDAHPFVKKDMSVGLNVVRYEPSMKHLNADFDDFFKYLNHRILETYNAKYPGFGRPLAIEGKMQKTGKGEGYHVWHSELDQPASKRVLAWGLFLNDVEEGGELEFLHQGLRYKPRRGDLVVCPAHFTHLHRGNPPLSGDKYLATGWYQYVDFNHVIDPSQDPMKTA